MVERRGSGLRVHGYLQVEGRGGCSARDMRRLLAALEESYQAAARVELAAERLITSVEWLSRHGPPPRYWFPGAAFTSSTSDVRNPADPLIVSRVVLESPGFWEFLGSLNPLEVVRQYLNDRHERAKDRDYRSEAERNRLVLENAMASLDVVERIAQLEREYGPDVYASEAWRRGWIADLRPALEQLAELDERRLIAGGTAITGREPPHRGPIPPADEM